MAGAFDFVPAIAVLPLVSFLVALFFGRNMPKRGALAGVAATAGSLLLSVWVAVSLIGAEPYQETVYSWVAGAGLGVELTFGVLIDPLSALMLVIVSLISLLVHVFSLGYMNDEREDVH